jgi:hypothetical protein
MLSSRSRRWRGDHLLQSARKRAPELVKVTGHGVVIGWLHLLLTCAQPRHLSERTRETRQRPGTAFGLRALLRFQMAAADDHLDQGQLALNRTRHPLDQKRACRGRRIVDTLDCGALDARVWLILAAGGYPPRALPLQSDLCRIVAFINDNGDVINVPCGGSDCRLARENGGPGLAG